MVNKTGWYNKNKLGHSVKHESHRHNLAARGIKTALPKGVKNVSFSGSPTPNFDMVKKSEYPKYKIYSCGAEGYYIDKEKKLFYGSFSTGDFVIPFSEMDKKVTQYKGINRIYKPFYVLFYQDFKNKKLSDWHPKIVPKNKVASFEKTLSTFGKKINKKTDMVSGKRGTKLIFVGTKEELESRFERLITKGTHTLKELPKNHPERYRGGYGVYRKPKMVSGVSYPKGKRISIKTIEGDIVKGKSLGVISRVPRRPPILMSG